MSNTKRPSWVAYDVESEKLSHEVAGGWDNAFGFGLTVGCTVDNNRVSKVFSAHNSSDARQRLLDYLLTFDRVVNFNGLRFDNNVVAGDTPDKLAHLNERTWDIKELMERACKIDGKRGPHIISLVSVAKPTIAAIKSDGYEDGREAVRKWRRGEYQSVIDYCGNDASMTAEVYGFGLRHGFVLFDPARFPLLFNGVAPLVVRVPALWKTND